MNVMLKLPPGAMFPEFHAPLSLVDVWAVLSLFVHVTVPPTAMATGFGEYAVVVSVDEPLTIDTGVPVTIGEVGDELQPIARIRKAAAEAIRRLMQYSPSRAFASFLPAPVPAVIAENQGKTLHRRPWSRGRLTGTPSQFRAS